MTEHIEKMSRRDSVLIICTDDEANKLLHPYNDAMVGEIRITDNIICRALIDNKSSVYILFMAAFTRLKIGRGILAPIQSPLYGFAGKCV